MRWETNPDDLAGMIAAEGILTSHGGKTSHAAVIARGMGAPCVCGVEALKIDGQEGGRHRRHRPGHPRGRHDSIDGTTGTWPRRVELVMPELTGDLDTILEWADEPAPGCARQRRQPGGRPALRLRAEVSACAAPSTCSWATASRSSRRSS
ncbi:MAG: PEP-utilizing enzyme [Adlercreutzia equolifaciens]